VSAVREQPGRALRHVTSADGTVLALEKVTDGAVPLVTVSGGPSLRTAWSGVAAELAGAHECWLMDRRGKGDSTDTEPYSFEREFDDLDAVAAAFGNDLVLAGHSSGAVCVLGAAARGLEARALVLYEPPWPDDARERTPDELDEMEAHLAAGDPERALETGMRRMVKLPAAVVEAMKASPLWAERVALAHTWAREGRELDRMPRGTASLAAVRTPTLVLGGELSPPHHHVTNAALGRALPRATLVELPGQNHSAPQTAPQPVAAAIREFTSSPAR
jgi:pimeloyl-ACP methyl ester carboxylesterase